MHRTTTRKMGRIGLATAIACLCLSAQAQGHENGNLTGPVAPPFDPPALHHPSVHDDHPSPGVPEIRGKVIDTKGAPVAGVSVTIKGSGTATVTGTDGSFRLDNAQATDTLVFTIVGYIPQEIAVPADNSTMTVTLEQDMKQLGDVVVVGYGTQRKVNLTGAVSQVNATKELVSRAAPNVSSALSGLVPGLSAPQSSGMAGNNRANLLIRGMGTVNNASPLIVVDGMPDVDLNRIDMNDIATISVLKDAASSAVYGSRAANGVLLITTKSGKGRTPQFSFTMTNGVQKPVKGFNFLADYPRSLTLEQRLAAVNTLPSGFLFKNGTIDQWMALGMIDPLKYPNTDWLDVTTQDGHFERYNFSASGGNEQSNFYISIGKLGERGIQMNNEYGQYNARVNYDYKLNRNMNVGVKLTGNTSNFLYTYENGFTGGDGAGGGDYQYAIAGILPYDPATGYYGGVMAYGEDPTALNPYVFYVNALKRRSRQEGNGNIYWDWTPVKGLTARVAYAINYYNQFQKQADIPTPSFNFQTNTLGPRVFIQPNAPAINQNNTGYKTMATGQLTYTTTIAHDHDIALTGVYSEEYWNDRVLRASRNDRIYPTIDEIDGALTAIQSTGGNSVAEGLRSVIGRINYTGFQKYLFEATFRYDGSSKFLQGSQYGFFPSVSAGWRFSEENFFQSFAGRIVNSGKLRMSYGTLGNNSGVSAYQQRETLTLLNYMMANNITRGFVYSQMVNRDLTWETTRVFNTGLDLSFLNNRLQVTVDYYDRLTTGMNRPGDLSILLSGAYNAPRRNIGNLRNRGIEGSFTWSERLGEFRYGITLNASYNATTLEKWNEFLGKGYTFLNMPYHFVYGYEDLGIAQTWDDVYRATPQGASPGDLLRRDLNGDGRIDDNDRRATTTNRDMPNTNFSLNSNFSYKNFDLSVLLQGATGRKDYWLNVYNNLNFTTQRYAATEDHWTNPWALDNRNGLWPRLNGSANNRAETTFWLDDMSYLRVKNVQVGYSLPTGILNRIHLKNCRLFLSAENLATISSFRGLDPEKEGNVNDVYPFVKSYSFGLNLGF
ncbi:TonB-dependent receptor [Terrimonas sp. NA20]|uniref:TonB-dependent receptor n=1 Tax=Terrimonas ginsenosidimutans TaxID=2908004 RepID=A0ABS9KT54_9BACT|nr:TonB-dependent receptor [Terrimonas ginsenosidimutans]MCG2615474.1 TonB-dependent receptor [Terrimonas ginsenosidimutans]